MALHRRIFLIGLSGSGKTTLAPLVARLLGWSWADLDRAVEAATGQPVPALLSSDEAAFRAVESRALAEIAQREPIAIATGGGAVLTATNCALMHESGVVVWLRIDPETAAARLAQDSGAERPLLRGDPVARLHHLQDERASLYAEADVAIAADAPPEIVARRVVAGLAARGLLPPAELVESEDIPVPLAHASHAIAVGWGKLAELPRIVHETTGSERAIIITDSAVADLYLPGVQETMRRAGIDATSIVMPAGEQHKTLATVAQIYDELIAARAERSTPLVALGGGVIGDLAGFVAATYLRGVPLIQVPITLLAQVDASIGGKVGVNHPHAKNAIGAFYQPRAIVCDPAALVTLSERVFHEGFGEIVKYGMALDADLFTWLEAQREALAARDASALVKAIAWCAAIKARVIAGDERESGPRIILNYGHTIGHALETVTGYQTLLHGEAVALGMAVETRIGKRLGMIDDASVARQDALLASLCPMRDSASPHDPLSIFDGEEKDTIDPVAVLEATRLDKKSRGGRVRWVLPTGVGSATAREDVPDDLVLAVLRDWLASLTTDRE
jgi:shikimate kinase/3-dehydroquinate synthase